jgi:hypothetical protein
VRSFFEEDTSLDELYLHLLEESGDRLVAAIRIIARGEPTLVHCTVGKDRTGVTVALALSAVEADRDAIIADYALTESQLPPERSRRIVAYLRAQHPEAVHAIALATESPAPVMRALLETGVLLEERAHRAEEQREVRRIGPGDLGRFHSDLFAVTQVDDVRDPLPERLGAGSGRTGELSGAHQDAGPDAAASGRHAADVADVVDAVDVQNRHACACGSRGGTG